MRVKGSVIGDGTRVCEREPNMKKSVGQSAKAQRECRTLPGSEKKTEICVEKEEKARLQDEGNTIKEVDKTNVKILRE